MGRESRKSSIAESYLPGNAVAPDREGVSLNHNLGPIKLGEGVSGQPGGSEECESGLHLGLGRTDSGQGSQRDVMIKTTEERKVSDGSQKWGGKKRGVDVGL